MEKYTIGIDYGTDSVRALVVNTATGENIATAVSYYSRWKKQMYCDAALAQFRQHPLDYIESLDEVLLDVTSNIDEATKQNIVGISVDTTGSTPIAVDKDGVPLSLHPDFADNPNAMFILWKDHTAIKEAEEINFLSKKWEVDYTKYVGGIYSAEWFWAKILHILRKDEQVRASAYSWVEHCDWISGYLAGNKDLKSLKRSRCAAGHKGMWNEAFDGLPSDAYFKAIDPLLGGLRERLYEECYTSDVALGTISSALAAKFGLNEDVIIGVGAFDCHMGAVGAKIKPYDFVRVMGTSTCDMLVAPKGDVGNILVKGICGQVDGSITAGMIGMEAGQSAYGDYYAWWQNIITDPVRAILGEQAAQDLSAKLLPYLAEQASKLPTTEHDLVATDWINGRRTPDADQSLKAAFMGMDLGTDTVAIFKMIVEATAFGSRAIVERFIEEGIRINQVVAIGGVAKKSPFVMQVLSDVLNKTIKVASSDQACALGAAINAAVAAGVYATTSEAQEIMGSDFDEIYHPRDGVVPIYDVLYKKYISLGKFIENNV